MNAQNGLTAGDHPSPYKLAGMITALFARQELDEVALNVLWNLHPARDVVTGILEKTAASAMDFDIATNVPDEVLELARAHRRMALERICRPWMPPPQS